jgi:UDP-2-acetamido-3-amino-2,3-dideoxy-glucuronate N-acetyltransferase
MNGVRIHNYTWIGDKVDIGKGSKIQAFAFIPNGVEIGKDVFIGPHVCFCNDKYPRAKGMWTELGTVVKDGASIGANSTILPGVTIGEDAMIGAGSVVTKDVPKGAKWVGTSIVQ